MKANSKSFSEWVKGWGHDAPAGDRYNDLPDLSKLVIDAAIKRYIEWLQSQQPESDARPYVYDEKDVAGLINQIQLRDKEIAKLKSQEQPVESEDDLWDEAFTIVPVRIHPMTENYLKKKFTIKRK